MEYTFETVYNQKAVSAMVRTLRKTLRKKRSRRTHIWGWIVLILAFFLAWPVEDGVVVIGFRNIVTWLAMLVILVVMLFEDHINAYIARARMLNGTEKSVVTFGSEHFSSTLDIGKSEWNYERILAIAETADYFVFLFDMNHGQVYAKSSLTGGTVDQFRDFIETRTGMPVEFVK